MQRENAISIIFVKKNIKKSIFLLAKTVKDIDHLLKLTKLFSQ